MKILKALFSATVALTFTLAAQAQMTIGVTNLVSDGTPGGTSPGNLRTDIYVDNALGFGFYAPSGVGSVVNRLGYWDPTGAGLLLGHTVALYQYSGSGVSYNLLASVDIQAGTVDPLVGGYRWASIPTLSLPDNGQGGHYYILLSKPDAGADAPSGNDYWTELSPLALDPSIGTVAGWAYASSIGDSTINNMNGGSGVQWGGANLGFEPVPEPGACALIGGGMAMIFALRRKK